MTVTTSRTTANEVVHDCTVDDADIPSDVYDDMEGQQGVDMANSSSHGATETATGRPVTADRTDDNRDPEAATDREVSVDSRDDNSGAQSATDLPVNVDRDDDSSSGAVQSSNERSNAESATERPVIIDRNNDSSTGAFVPEDGKETNFDEWNVQYGKALTGKCSDGTRSFFRTCPENRKEVIDMLTKETEEFHRTLSSTLHEFSNCTHNNIVLTSYPFENFSKKVDDAAKIAEK